ncbi:MAG: M4 family metallopeptidase, partial [Rhodobacteraceae bacterium]|nr:M4 family metallopeptidase [Paracoccaceae bacterium]
GYDMGCPVHRDSRLCIVPPHMLRVLEMRGDRKTAAMARRLLDQSCKIRDERAAIAARPMLAEDGDAPGFVAEGYLGAAAARGLVREIHDGEGKAALPGKLVRAEGDPPTGDAGADGAYDGAEAVYDLYFEEFGRNSLDGAGMTLVATVHHRRNFNNAFWDGSQMAYGDGDGEIFRTFIETSVIGHEMSHGVVQFSGGLVYEGQSGALNESFADVFGAQTRQRLEGTGACESDWLIGKGILGPEIKGVALRSMKMPGTAYSDALLGQDPQPYHMDFYVNTTEDNGGVHVNSGIPNHAFYLYCMYLGGNSWGVPGQVWYDALQRLNNPYASFHDWATQTVQSAVQLHGVGSREVLALRRAWTLVGLAI